MTNFEKLKNMTQDEAVEYIRYRLCFICGGCEDCPMFHGYPNFESCISDVFADWLEAEVKN